jgi:hypothetical protein
MKRCIFPAGIAANRARRIQQLASGQICALTDIFRVFARKMRNARFRLAFERRLYAAKTAFFHGISVGFHRIKVTTQKTILLYHNGNGLFCKSIQQRKNLSTV